MLSTRSQTTGRRTKSPAVPGQPVGQNVLVAAESGKRVWFLNVRNDEVVPSTAMARAIQNSSGWTEVRLQRGEPLTIRGIKVIATNDDVLIGNEALGNAKNAVVSSDGRVAMDAFLRNFDR